METLNTSKERCVGCFSDEYSLQSCRFQNNILTTLFQANNLSLCYICKKIAHNTENFIQNVQSNQLILQSLQTSINAELKMINFESHPLVNLKCSSLDSIVLTGDGDSEEPFPILVYSSRRVEPKTENDDSCSINGDYVDNDIGLDEIKDETLSMVNFKIEEGTEILDDISSSQKRLIRKSKKIKKKNKVKKKECLTKYNEEGITRIIKVRITRRQCMKEREELAKKSTYLNSAYKCEDCVKGFIYKDIYHKHMKTHDKSNGDFECDICKQRMMSIEKLLSHQKYHVIRYQCSECGILRVCRSTILDHMAVAHSIDNGTYPCPECTRTFKSKTSLNKHKHYSHKTSRATCDYCYRSYANKDSLRCHMLRKHSKQIGNGKVNKGHICPQCGRAFYSAGALRVHLRTHAVDRNYYCVECNKSFKTDISLKQHLKIAAPHVQYVELPLQCEHCDKRFGIKRDLERHMNRIHLNNRPFQCDKCEKAYVNSWSLREHVQYKHEGYIRPRTFPCSMCDKVFQASSIRKAHMRTHTGERPYKCTKCPAQFSQAGVRNTHFKLVHLKLTRDGKPKPSNSFR